MSDKKSAKKWVIALCVIAALAAVGAGVWFFWLKDYLAVAGSDPVYVNSVSVIAGLDTGSNPKYSGIVEPQTTYKINKDESKTVEEVFVKEGDQVRVGDPLFSYNTDEMQLSLDQAQLDLEGIANQISTLKTQKSTLEKEKKNASKDDQYSYTVQIQAVELQIKTEEYNSSVKQSEIDKLKDSLANAQVTSEVDGVIKEINTTPGTDSSGQQKPFISILSSGEYRVKGTVTEMNLADIQQGMAVTIYSRVNGEQSWQGVVETVEKEPVSTDGSTGGMVMMDGSGTAQNSSKYYFYVSLDPSAIATEGNDGLILGQHVYIEPDQGEQEQRTGIWLPAFYVDHDESGSFVWAKDENDKLEKRDIILGSYDSDADLYEIKSGLVPTDYIAFPDASLKPGMPTTVDASAAQQTPGMDGSMDTDGVLTPDGSTDGVLTPEGDVTMDGGMIAEDGTYTEDGTITEEGTTTDDGTFTEDSGETQDSTGEITYGESDGATAVIGGAGGLAR